MINGYVVINWVVDIIFAEVSFTVCHSAKEATLLKTASHSNIIYFVSL